MPSSCPECGSSNVVEDDLYSQKQWVCEDCGSLVSEGLFTTTLSDEQQSRMVPYYASTEVTKKPCSNLVKGLVRVRALCRILRLSGDEESGAVSLFQRAYNHPTFLHTSLMKKEVLGGSCVLWICRQNNFPISLGTISNLLEADPALIGLVYLDLTKALGIEPISATSITNMLESYCHSFKLCPGEVSEVFVETPQRLVERSTALVELAADTWLVTGRHPLQLLTACVYIAWQSLKPVVRVKCSLGKFCQISRLNNPKSVARNSTVQKRLSELRDVLCKLGRELPWLRGGIPEPGTIAMLVDDILKHRQTLLLMALKHYEEEFQKCTEHKEPPPPPLISCRLDQEEDRSRADSDSHLSGLEDSELQSGNKTGLDSAPPAGEVHWGKRQLFLPPSARIVKRPRMDPPGPTVTGDEEISDTEIETYIRSPEEVKMFLKIKKKLEKH